MINTLLAQRESEGRPIRVGIIRAGKFGGALTVQISKIKGMVVAGIADLNLETARKAYTNGGVSAADVQHVESIQALENTISRGKPTVTQDARLLIGAGPVGVIVEATGVPDIGALSQAAIWRNPLSRAGRL